MGTKEGKSALRVYKTKKRPFRYERSGEFTDVFALSPQEILDACKFLVGWIHFAPKHHKHYAMPLYAGLIDVARYVLGVRLRGNRWYLPDKYTARLQEAGIEYTGPKDRPWRVVDWNRFYLAVYQIMTEGRYDVRKQRKWLKMGAEAPAFEYLYPKGSRERQDMMQTKERSDEFLKTHFAEEINSRLFDK